MSLRFTKMQGLGNDFIVFDAVRQRVELNAARIRALADRRFGIGCDQILLVEPPRLPETDFHYRIFNADGSEVEQCGNGARCFARFVRDQGLSEKTSIPVGTAAGRITLYLEPDGQVRVNMGAPVLDPVAIPFEAEQQAVEYGLRIPDIESWMDQGLEIADGALRLGALSMGNPHAVLRVSDLDSAPVAQLGSLIEQHPRFPRRVNVGFMQILSPTQMRLRVYERGAGETLACGTGACAAVVSGQLRGWLDEEVRVTLPGGTLSIRCSGASHAVWMTGPAEPVFQGEID